MNSEIYFEGKKYISVKMASELTGYSRDYVGQLCRLNKIQSRRIDRSWYVSESSILNYNGTPESKIVFPSEIVKSRPAEISKTLQTKDLSVNRKHKSFFTNLSKIAVFSVFLCFVITGALSLKTFDFQKLSKYISSAPFEIYSALDEVVDLHSSKLSRVYIETGDVLIDETNNLVNDPNYYFTKKLEYLALTEVEKIDAGVLFANDLIQSSKRNSLSFVNDSLEILNYENNSKDNNYKLLSLAFGPFEKSSILIYKNINSLIDKALYSPFIALFGDKQPSPSPAYVLGERKTKPVIVAQNTTPSKPQTTTSTTPVVTQQTITNNNIIQRTVERVIVGDVTKAYVDTSLQQLQNQLTAELSRLSIGNGGAVTNIYHQIAQSQKIDNLYNTAISNPVITNGSISGTTISTPNLSADNASLSSLSTTNLTVAGAGMNVLLSTDSNGLVTSTSTPSFGNFNAMSTNSTSTVAIGGFTVGDNQFVIQQNSGRIGIGTTSPNALFDFKQSVNGTTMFSFTRNTDLVPTGDLMNYKTADGATTLFRVDNSGNLLAGGIVTSGSQTITSVSTPQSRVQYDASNEVTFSTNSTGSTTIAASGTNSSINFATQNNLVNAFNFMNASGNSVLNIDTVNGRVGVGTSSPYGQLSVNPNGMIGPAFVIGSSTATNFIVANDGNVAIGTTTTSLAKLMINNNSGSGIYSLIMGSDSVGRGMQLNTQDYSLGVSGTSLRIGLGSGSGNTWADIYNTYAGTTYGNLALQAYGGNVGIGTTTPGQKLSVAGDILGNNIIGSYFTATSTTATSTFAGSVGIGTTTPNNTFQVVDLIDFNNSILTTKIGYQAGKNANPTAIDNTYIGYQAGLHGVGGGSAAAAENLAIGTKALYSNIGGNDDVAVGPYSLYNNTSGDFNTAVGTYSLFNNTIASNNSALGYQSMYRNQDGTNNTGIGYNSLFNNVSGSGNVALGYLAGKYETGSNAFYVDNQDRTNTTNEKASALLYGQFNANPSLQKLTINANVGIGTTTPGQKLSVAGDILGNNIIGSYFTATSTTATTTLAGGLAVGTTGFVYDFSTGNVGIGTSSPAAKLDVSGKFLVNSDGIIVIGENSANSTISIETSNNQYSVWKRGGGGPTTWMELTSNGSGPQFPAGVGFGAVSNSTRDVSLTRSSFGTLTLGGGTDNSGTANLIVTGNVGIGTTTPGQKLSVAGDILGNNIIGSSFTATSTTATTTLAGGLRVGNPTVGYHTDFQNADTGGIYLGYSNSLLGSFTANAGSGEVRIGGTNTGGQFWTTIYANGGEAMRFRDGMAGINTTTDNATRLAISEIDGNNRDHLRLINNTGGTGKKWALNSEDTGNFTIKDASGSLGKVFNITNSGNVGIGTTSPYSKLSIQNLATDSVAPLFTIASSTATATTTLLTVLNSGNVGIGTDAPGALLDVRSGVASGDFPLMVRGNIDNFGTGYTGIKFGYEGGTGVYEKAAIMVKGTSGYVQPEMHFLLDNNADATNADINDARLSILPGGNVGIGSTSPMSLLGVQSTTGSSEDIFNIRGGADNSSEYTGIKIWNNAGLNSFAFRSILGLDGDGRLGVFTKDNGSYTSETERLSIQSSGKVGIGTSSPYTRFAVSNNASDNTAIIESTAGIASLEIKAQSTAAVLKINRSDTSAGSQIYLQTAGAINWGIGNGIGRVTSDLQFYDYASAEAMVIKSTTGNVGIGTTTPDAKLTVNGTTRIMSNTPTLPTSGTSLELYYGASVFADSPAAQLISYDRTNGAYKPMVFDASRFNFSTGNVGIGTTSPGALLHLNSTTGSVRQYIEAPSTSFIAETRYYNGDNSSFNIGVETASGGNIVSGSSARAGVLNRNGAFPLQFATNNAIAMTILSGGNVGIGTTSPSKLLHVYGSASSVARFESTASTGASINLANSGTQSFVLGAYSSITGSGTDMTPTLFSETGLGINFATNGSVTRQMVIDTAGNVGIGTASPQKTLHLSMAHVAVGNNAYAGNVVINTTDAQAIDKGGSMSLGGSYNDAGAPWTFGVIHAGKANGTTGNSEGYMRFLVNANGGSVIERMRIVGDTGVISGDFNDTSDVRLKKNIQGLSGERGLDAIKRLNPLSFEWINENQRTGEQLGFTAQEIQLVFPELVANTGTITDETPDGMLVVKYTGLIAPIVKAVQELDYKIESLASSTPEVGSLGERVITNILTKTKEWLASATNDITQIIAGTFRAKDQLCINNTCVTEAQLQALLASSVSGSQQSGGGGGGGGQATSTPPVDTSLPVVTILGDNPATITVGTSYVDLGATVTDTNADGSVNDNLGIYFNVNGTDMASVTIDTTATSTHTIIYSAIDGVGNVGTATRVVNVVEQ